MDIYSERLHELKRYIADLLEYSLAGQGIDPRPLQHAILQHLHSDREHRLIDLAQQLAACQALLAEHRYCDELVKSLEASLLAKDQEIKLVKSQARQGAGRIQEQDRLRRDLQVEKQLHLEEFGLLSQRMRKGLQAEKQLHLEEVGLLKRRLAQLEQSKRYLAAEADSLKAKLLEAAQLAAKQEEQLTELRSQNASIQEVAARQKAEFAKLGQDSALLKEFDRGEIRSHRQRQRELGQTVLRMSERVNRMLHPWHRKKSKYEGLKLAAQQTRRARGQLAQFSKGVKDELAQFTKLMARMGRQLSSLPR